jgi:hypothetical protein
MLAYTQGREQLLKVQKSYPSSKAHVEIQNTDDALPPAHPHAQTLLVHRLLITALALLQHFKLNLPPLKVFIICQLEISH